MGRCMKKVENHCCREKTWLHFAGQVTETSRALHSGFAYPYRYNGGTVWFGEKCRTGSDLRAVVGRSRAPAEGGRSVTERHTAPGRHLAIDRAAQRSQ